jgi:hypothetical protein
MDAGPPITRPAGSRWAALSAAVTDAERARQEDDRREVGGRTSFAQGFRSPSGVAPADGGEEAVWRDVQERVERTSESVPQHCVARAMPTGVANDQVRRREDRRDETDKHGQGDERDDNHHDEDEERRAHEEAYEDQSPDLDRTERQRSHEADLGGDLLDSLRG